MRSYLRLVDVPRLVTAYYVEHVDPAVPAQRVAFGTSGHRGSSLRIGFNEAHVLAITQAICTYRKAQGIDGPLFLGWDTHALSQPACASAVEVLVANGVDVMLDARDAPAPTPVVSQAIVSHNRIGRGGVADGVVITPSHNPPEYGGFKYDPPSGPRRGGGDGRDREVGECHSRVGHAGSVTRSIRARVASVHHAPVRLPRLVRSRSRRGPGRGRTENAKLDVGVDALGGASADYWEPIAARYGLHLAVVNAAVDPTFRFMTVDWDGQIRMDPSSPYAMEGLIGSRGRYDLSFANDPDADRHGIVCRSAGLLNPNHYLAVSIDYLFRHRPEWKATAAIGKTIVSSRMIDRVAGRLGRRLVEVPVGFKYFVEGLGDPAYARIDAEASEEEKRALATLAATDASIASLGGDPVRAIVTTAGGDRLPLGGIKVVTDHGWFAARPSGTEAVYKLYAESFKGHDHLVRIQEEAQAFLRTALQSPRPSSG